WTVAFGISLALAYATFAVSATVGLSGVLATVVTAATLGNVLRRRWSDAILARELDRAWAFVAVALSSVTFLAIGAVIDPSFLADAAGAIAIGVIAVVVARALLVYVPFVVARP